SEDQTPGLLPQVDGLRYHRRASNGGFIAACNEGAGLARGRHLVLLNNDTVPQPGWLHALLATFETHPDAGLVGAQLLYPDGRLQEAGGIVFNDGSARNYGRFGDPSDPRHAYLRDIDYASAAAIAIPRDLFLQLGGFDARYAPAYYEDTDLAFAVRAAGRRVLYQPGARVIHDEGASSGTDISSGVKACQVRNREVFLAHRHEALARLPAPHEPSPATLHAHQRQVLVIDALTPRPDRDSGSLRLVNLMRLLREEGAHVVFLPANRHYDGRYTDALRQLGVEAWSAPHAARAPAWLAEHGPRFDVAMVCRHYARGQRRRTRGARSRCARRARRGAVQPAQRVRSRPALRPAPRPGLRRRLPPSAQRGRGALVRGRGAAAGAQAPARSPLPLHRRRRAAGDRRPG